MFARTGSRFRARSTSEPRAALACKMNTRLRAPPGRRSDVLTSRTAEPRRAKHPCGPRLSRNWRSSATAAANSSAASVASIAHSRVR
jgi:hypothetical protein